MEIGQNMSVSEIGVERERREKEREAEFVKERKEVFHSLSGIPMKSAYTPEDLAEKGFDYLRDLSIHPLVILGERW